VEDTYLRKLGKLCLEAKKLLLTELNEKAQKKVSNLLLSLKQLPKK
jgi:hypothetical protein